MIRRDVYYIYICADNGLGSHDGESIEIRLQGFAEGLQELGITLGLLYFGVYVGPPPMWKL